MGRTGIAVSSMGIHAPKDATASKDAVVICAEHNIDISEHKSRPLLFDELKAASFLFVMETYQRDFIRTFVPQVAENLFLLGAWPGKEKKEHNVPDPIGGSLKDYQKTFNLLSSHIDRIMPFLLAELE
jgi:protein-tyrosine-phosphatase